MLQHFVIQFPPLLSAIFVFQYYHNLLLKAFGQLLYISLSKHSYNTRLASKSTYYIDQVRNNYGKFNLQFSGPTIWNNLDEQIKSLSLRLFKQNLTKQFLSSYA